MTSEAGTQRNARSCHALRAWVAIASAVALTAAPAGASAAMRAGVIDHVADGDTVVLRGGETIRLVQIDTPEVYGDTECYGPTASAVTKALLPRGTRVRVATDPGTRSARPRRPHAGLRLEGLVARQSPARTRRRCGAVLLRRRQGPLRRPDLLGSRRGAHRGQGPVGTLPPRRRAASADTGCLDGTRARHENVEIGLQPQLHALRAELEERSRLPPGRSPGQGDRIGRLQPRRQRRRLRLRVARAAQPAKCSQSA